MFNLLRLLLTVVLLTAVLSATTANAAGHRKPASRTSSKAKSATPLAQAVTVAERYWGVSPCHGEITVLKRQKLAPGVARGSEAWVTFNSPLGANNLSAPASDYSSCAIHLARNRWPTKSSMLEDWDMLCMTVTHEYGHLFGLEHNATMGNIMVPKFSDYSSEPLLCSTKRPRSAPVR